MTCPAALPLMMLRRIVIYLRDKMGAENISAKTHGTPRDKLPSANS